MEAADVLIQTDMNEHQLSSGSDILTAYRLNIDDVFAEVGSAVFIHMLRSSCPFHAYPSKSSFISPFKSTTIGKLPFADGTAM